MFKFDFSNGELRIRTRKPLRVLSLFDGYSGGRVALAAAKIPVEVYYSSEIDKHAIKVSDNNWPDIIRLGDVLGWRDWDIDWSKIDLLLGGSPCQGFSFAGKQLAFDDPRSALFFVYVDILRHIQSVNPNVKFLLENVRMKKDYLDIISELVGVKPQLTNSALVSAQNRQRFYWANWPIKQPEDRNVMLSHILDPMHDEAALQSESWHEWWSRNHVFQQRKKYSQLAHGNDKAITMTARQYGSWQGNYVVVARGSKRVGRRIGANGKRDDHNRELPYTQRDEIREDEKAFCLTTVSKDSMVAILREINERVEGVTFGHDGIRPHRGDSRKSGISELGRLLFRTARKSYSITTTHAPKLIESLTEDTIIIRKFSVGECERLQTLETGYCSSVSATQSYKMLGNGFNTDTIEGFLSDMPINFI